MLITIKNLLKLPVVTESGVKLGKVLEVELDAASHAVKYYQVGEKWFGKNCLISPSQVKIITKEKMVVVNAALAEPNRRKAATVLAETNLSRAMTRSE